MVFSCRNMFVCTVACYFSTLRGFGARFARNVCVVTKGLVRGAGQLFFVLVGALSWMWTAALVVRTNLSCCSWAGLSSKVRLAYRTYSLFYKRMRRKHWIGASDGSFCDEYFIIAHDYGRILVGCLGCYVIYQFLCKEY